MAVSITSPQSAVLARNRFTLSWTCTYPQSAYEIMYRKRGDTAWSTFGRVSSTAKSVAVDCSRFEDFIEYQYKVVVYSNYDNSVDISYSGNDDSAAYALILVPESMVGTMKVKYGSGMIEVPLYSTTHSGTQLNIANNKKTALIDPNNSATSGSSAGSKLRVRDTPSTTKVAPGAYKYLSATGVARKTSLTSRYTYYSTSSTYKDTYTHTYYSRYTIPAYYRYEAKYYTLKTPAYYQYNAEYYTLRTAAYYAYTRAYYKYTPAYYTLYSYSWCSAQYVYTYSYYWTLSTYSYKFGYEYFYNLSVPTDIMDASYMIETLDVHPELGDVLDLSWQILGSYAPVYATLTGINLSLGSTGNWAYYYMGISRAPIHRYIEGYGYNLHHCWDAYFVDRSLDGNYLDISSIEEDVNIYLMGSSLCVEGSTVMFYRTTSSIWVGGGGTRLFSSTYTYVPPNYKYDTKYTPAYYKYTPAYYKYTAPTYNTIPAYYAYTPATYNTIPAYYEYIATKIYDQTLYSFYLTYYYYYNNHYYYTKITN